MFALPKGDGDSADVEGAGNESSPLANGGGGTAGLLPGAFEPPNGGNPTGAGSWVLKPPLVGIGGSFESLAVGASNISTSSSTEGIGIAGRLEAPTGGGGIEAGFFGDGGGAGRLAPSGGSAGRPLLFGGDFSAAGIGSAVFFDAGDDGLPGIPGIPGRSGMPACEPGFLGGPGTGGNVGA